MPIQMLAMMTETSDQCGAVSQWTGETPKSCSTELTTPESLLNIHDQVDADTISGSSHGTRNSARNVAESLKLRKKNTARARPAAYWKIRDTTVKTSVCSSAVLNVGLCSTWR